MSARPLIIVESPTKVKTIKRFLGSGYDVEASGGHVRDLPKSRMGIDIDHDYEPSYIAIRGKGETIRTLKEKAKKASKAKRSPGICRRCCRARSRSAAASALMRSRRTP